jgi:hypothetical protein
VLLEELTSTGSYNWVCAMTDAKLGFSFLQLLLLGGKLRGKDYCVELLYLGYKDLFLKKRGLRLI